ncbi:hypothetical protein PFISCL1PPCAC_26892, partial [Pristionchus fissidentatus]
KLQYVILESRPPSSCLGGTSLATVAENLPLTYNMATRSLDSTKDGVCTSEQSTPRQFKRGHIRRSSYESADIQLDFARRHDPRPSLINRTSFEEALCSLHLAAREERERKERDRLAEEKTKEEDCGLSCTSTDTRLTPDSAIGDSVESKRSSLDRKSDLSVGDWEETEEEAASSSSTHRPRRKIVSFAKGLFSRKDGRSSSWKNPFSKMKELNGVVHTTSLILEERPSHLPAKSAEEANRHKQLHQEMIVANKRREAKAEKERQRQTEEKNRLEEQAMSACRHWSEQILPKWDEMRNSKRCRELWWQGVPSSIRGKVWSLAVGNELNITPELYDCYSKRADKKLVEYTENKGCDVSEPSSSNGNRENSLAQIHLDVSRTFPSLGIFQKDGPYYDSLQKLLGTYVCYRPDVGYVQSMSFIAGLLLLQMEPFPAFVTFANLMNRPLQMAFFQLQQPEMTEYFIAFDRYFAQELKELHAHFDEIDVRPDLYLIEWVYTLFSKSLPLELTCRVWDVFLRDDEEFVFKTALGLLRMHEKSLLSSDFEGVVSFLTHLPDSLNGADLFRNIEPFMRSYPCNTETARSKKRFFQILAEVKEQFKPARSESSATVESSMSTSVQSMKMSKSLSSFIGDLLKPTTD